MPAEELNRRIRGDWFEIRETYDELYELEEVFSFSVEELSAITAALRNSVEHGIIEYKRHTVGSLFSFLDGLKYDSRGFDALASRARGFQPLVYLVLIQRLIAMGSIAIRSGESKEPASEESHTEIGMGMKEILQEIQERMKTDPEIKQHPAVKNIFMQVSIYRRELDNMKKLAPNIPKEKQPSFYANFKTSFDRITEKIREHYREIEREDVAEAAKQVVSTNPLKTHDLKGLAKLFESQAKEYTLVSSTLRFAAEERYKTRDILAQISERQERLELLVSNELGQYHSLEPGEDGERAFSRAFTNELITVLNRQITRMS